MCLKTDQDDHWSREPKKQVLLEDRSIISKNKRNSFKKIPIGGPEWEKLELPVRLSIVNLLVAIKWNFHWGNMGSL